MTGNSIGNSVPPPQNAPQSTGIAAPNQAAGSGAVSFKALNKAARELSLNRTLSAWEKRADKSDARKDFDELARLSTAVLHNKGDVIGSHGIDEEFTADEVKEHRDQEADRAVLDVEQTLFKALGNTNKVAKALRSKYEKAISTLRQYSGGSANLTDAKARMRGFTNLKLFAAYGGDLHSTRGRTNKLARTIAKIPKIVLMNASEDVTFEDYGKADHLKFEGRRRRLLSFHIGFKARWSVFGKGKASRAYRENLRAVTASALLLGGVDKAVKVKKVLSEINSRPTLVDAALKEDIVKNALDRLATHGDVKALISDLQFELQRHYLLDAFNSTYNYVYANSNEKDFYCSVRNKFDKLENLPNRWIIIQNIAKKIARNEPGYGTDESRFPYNVLRDLKGITNKNPIKYFLDSQPKKNAKSALSAIQSWVGLMTQEGSEAQIRIDNQLVRINNEKSSKNRGTIYLNAAHLFAAIDKRNISVDDQCVLLRSCLRQPFARPSVHLKKLESQKARNQNDRIGNPNRIEPNPLRPPSNPDANEKLDIDQDVKPRKNVKESYEVKDEVEYGKTESQINKPRFPNKNEHKPPYAPSKADPNIRDEIDKSLKSNKNKNENFQINEDVKYDNDDIGGADHSGGLEPVFQDDHIGDIADFLARPLTPITEEPHNLETDMKTDEERQKPLGSSGTGDEWKDLPTTDFEDIKTDVSDDQPHGSGKADDPGDSSEISNDPEKTNDLTSDTSGKKDV